MFSSLDRMDMELATNYVGLRHFIQTDHRTREEIEENPELSALFALIRILNPQRLTEEGGPEPIVTYLLTEMDPPPFLEKVIRIAGGQLQLGMELMNPLSIKPKTEKISGDDLRELIQKIMLELALATAKKYSLPLTAEGLANLESLLTQTEKNEDQEFEYWSAVLELGCFAGEVIRQTKGQEWVLYDEGTLPLALLSPFQDGIATVNILGKAIKLFMYGKEDSVVTMARVLLSAPN